VANRESPGGAAVKTRVLVVDDSPLVRAVLGEAFAAVPDIEVVGEAGDGKTAVELAERLRPAATRRHQHGRAHARDGRAGGDRADHA